MATRRHPGHPGRDLILLQVPTDTTAYYYTLEIPLLSIGVESAQAL